MRDRAPSPVMFNDTHLRVALELERFESLTIKDGFSAKPEDRERLLRVPNLETLDYGTITPEIESVCGLKAMPIRLANGRHHSYGGFGVAHIFSKHGRSLAKWGYYSVQDFVDHTAQTFDAVFLGRDGRNVLVSRTLKHPTMNRLIIIEPRKGTFYTVVSGWMSSASRPINGVLIAERIDKNGVLVWECRAPH